MSFWFWNKWCHSCPQQHFISFETHFSTVRAGPVVKWPSHVKLCRCCDFIKSQATVKVETNIYFICLNGSDRLLAVNPCKVECKQRLMGRMNVHGEFE